MAEGKIGGLTTAFAAIGSLAVGVVGTYLSMSDTTPKSLEEISDSLSKIAAAVDNVDNLDAESAATASAILLKANQIGERIFEKGTDLELENVAGVILNEDQIELGIGDTVAIELQDQERVSLTFHFAGNNYVQIYANGRLRSVSAGQRIFESEDTGCLVELFKYDREAPSLSLVSVCPPDS
ncbi:MAG: hypothetical protein AAF437_01405 [Pseudomonadota bacterium]